VLESVKSLARRRLEPKERADDALLIRHLPYVTALTDDVLMLRDGEIMATFAVDGIGAATAESVLVGDVADAVQAVVAERWETVNTENLAELADFEGYQSSFLRLFGFGLDGVDYAAETDPNVGVPSLG